MLIIKQIKMYPIRTRTWNLTVKKCENDRVSCSVLNVIVQNDNRLHLIFCVVFLSVLCIRSTDYSKEAGWSTNYPSDLP